MNLWHNWHQATPIELRPFSLFEDLQRKYDWVLETREYSTKETLLAGLEDAIIKPALAKHDELIARKMEKLKTIYIK